MKRPSRRALIATAVALVVVILGALIGLRIRDFAHTAALGKSQAVAGAKSLAAMDATSAVSHLEAAARAFESAKQSLGPEWVSGVVGWIPWAGHQYSTARTLADMGAGGSHAALELAKVLQRASVRTSTAQAGRGFAGIASGHTEIERSIAVLLDIAERGSALSLDGLVPPLADAVRSIQAALREAGPGAARARAMLPLLTYLLSSEHRILVVSQNGAELRPAGGFAGSFGIIEIGPAGVRLDEYKDVYTLPDPAGRVKPPLGARMTGDFSFRDANWWLDFPTSARAMLGFWSAYRQPPVDGLVIIDTVTMRELLAATGPVTVPSFKETFTSANLLDRLLYLVEVKRGGMSDRKDVLGALAAQLETRVLKAGPADLMKISRALGTAADEKHLQMYFTDTAAQAGVQALGWSGRVTAGDGSTDLLAVSNAMTKPGKVNVAMRKSIAYEVGLRADRSADTTLVLGYANTGAYRKVLPPDFRDWLRVYRLPGTVFPTTSPRGRKTATVTEFAFPAEVRTFTLHRGQSRTETLAAVVPEAMAPVSSTSVSSDAAHYRLLVIRQADLEDVPTTITVMAPPGWRITGASARYTASGGTVPVTREPGRVRVAVPLRGDLELDVRLASS